jgi:hypothetical protein
MPGPRLMRRLAPARSTAASRVCPTVAFRDIWALAFGPRPYILIMALVGIADSSSLVIDEVRNLMSSDGSS